MSAAQPGPAAALGAAAAANSYGAKCSRAVAMYQRGRGGKRGCLVYICELDVEVYVMSSGSVRCRDPCKLVREYMCDFMMDVEKAQRAIPAINVL